MNSFVFNGKELEAPYFINDVAKAYCDYHNIAYEDIEEVMETNSEVYDFVEGVFSKYETAIAANGFELEPYGFCTQDLIDWYIYRVEYVRQFNEHKQNYENHRKHQ